jgi:four helix bundle protein
MGKATNNRGTGSSGTPATGTSGTGTSGTGTSGTGTSATEVEARRKSRAVHGVFDHEKLQAYQVARECFVLTSGWLSRKMMREVREQFERSMISILSNIAEGAGKTAKADKRRFYEIAKGSTTEAAAQLEILHLRAVITLPEYRAARELLIRVAQMLHGLCAEPRTT